MPRPIDKSGERFGRLLVLELAGRNQHRQRLWKCRCDCGREVVVIGGSLASGNTRSCGCLHDEMNVRRSTTHGMASRAKRAPEYSIWLAMRSRCQKQQDPAYPNYGGRGIAVCERWQTFENFVSDMGRRPDKALTLERRDNDGSYEPENCYWASRTVQSRNQRSTSMVTLDGETLPLATLCERYGVISRGMVRWRMKRGWSLRVAVSTPPGGPRG